MPLSLSSIEPNGCILTFSDPIELMMPFCMRPGSGSTLKNSKLKTSLWVSFHFDFCWQPLLTLWTSCYRNWQNACSFLPHPWLIESLKNGVTNDSGIYIVALYSGLGLTIIILNIKSQYITTEWQFRTQLQFHVRLFNKRLVTWTIFPLFAPFPAPFDCQVCVKSNGHQDK